MYNYNFLWSIELQEKILKATFLFKIYTNQRSCKVKIEWAYLNILRHFW